MTKKSTKRSLAMSILSMVLCLAMLIGSTYAWFSDKAETDKVTITAGNLDVAIVDGNTQDNGVAEAEELTTLFKDTSLENNWEPGKMVKSDDFKIANKGTVALTYQVNVTATNADGSAANLMDVIKYKVVEANDTALTGLVKPTATYQERLDAWEQLSESDKTTGTVDAGKVNGENALVVVLFWEADPSTAEENKDNQYNKPGKEVKANFTVDVFATQASVEAEQDSFGKKYDEGAAEQLKQVTAVNNALSTGLNGLPSAINEAFAEAADINGMEGAISVSPLTKNEAGVSESTMTFSSDKFTGAVNVNQKKAMATAFMTSLNNISASLMQQKDSIESISIKANQDEGTVDMSKAEENQLKKSLMGALMAAISKSDFSSKPKITVNVTTTAGEVIPYVLNFDFADTNISTNLTDYATAILNACNEAGLM